MRSVPLERVRVDSFLIADGARAFEGKLYIHGGGWNFLNIEGPASTKHLSLAGRVIVPWNETDEEHELSIHLEYVESDLPIERVPIARFILAPRNQPEQRDSVETATPFAFDVGAVSFAQPGEYAFVITHNADELARARFKVNLKQESLQPTGELGRSSE